MTTPINPISVVETTTRALILQNAETSYFWDQAFETIHKVHLVWKIFEKFTIYGNPDNLLQLAGGFALHWVAGDNPFVKFAASAVMIATRIMECVKEQLLLLKEICKLYDICFDNTALYPNLKWAKPENFVFLSPSIAHWLRDKFIGLLLVLYKILKELLVILKQIFFLSMRMISAAEAFSLDPRVIREGTTELFVNLEKCYKALVENKLLLLDFLKDYQPVIEKLLEGLGNILSYQTLVDKVKASIEEDDQVKGDEGPTLKKYGQFALGHMIFGLFQAVNMQHLMPDAWIPSLEFSWWKDEKYARPNYPPMQWIQIIGYKAVVKGWQEEKRFDMQAKSVLFSQL